jgi:hypothetical protein
MEEYWQNSFCSGLACVSDGGDIVGSEKGRLSEAGRSSRRYQLACASTGDPPCRSWVIASRRACMIPGETLVAADYPVLVIAVRPAGWGSSCCSGLPVLMMAEPAGRRCSCCSG